MALRALVPVISIASAGCAQIVGADFDDPRARTTDGARDPPLYLKATGPKPGARFGYGLAMDAAGLLVTAPFEDDGSLPGVGATYYFDLTNLAEPPVRIVAPNSSAMDGHIPGSLTPKGFSAGDWGSLRVALSDELVVIGVPTQGGPSAGGPLGDSEPAAGVVYVYERAYLDEPVQTITAPRIESGALFGGCVALSGPRLAVGASLEDNPGAPDSGAVYVYERRDGRFDTKQVERVRPMVAHDGDQFGAALDIAGDLLVVGAPGESSKSPGIGGDPNDTSKKGAGAAYVYRLLDGWQLDVYVKSEEPIEGGLFGLPISISGERFATGAWGANSGCRDDPAVGGAAHIVAQTNGVWTIEQCLPNLSSPTWVAQGIGLDLLGDLLVVGAPWDFSGRAEDPDDTSLPFAGAGHVYRRDASGAWSERAYLKAPNLGVNDVFGFSIVLTSERLAIGAPQESGGESGPLANPRDDSASYAGAAFLYSVDSL